MNTFDNVSGQYKEKAVIQQTAASNLLSLIKIRKQDSIIDIACGPGHITYRLSKITNGNVTGIDISEGMIRQAKNLYPVIDFRQIAAEDIDYKNQFDLTGKAHGFSFLQKRTTRPSLKNRGSRKSISK